MNTYYAYKNRIISVNNYDTKDRNLFLTKRKSNRAINIWWGPFLVFITYGYFIYR